MAEHESSNLEPEEEVIVKVWDYRWPEGALVDSFSAATTAQQWFDICDSEQEALGVIGHALSMLMKGDVYPSPEQLELLGQHPQMKDRILRLCNFIFVSHAGTDLTQLSRAIVLLGSKTVRNLAFCAALYNRLLVEPTPKSILPELVRMQLAGKYAVLFACRKDPKLLNAEEIYVAAAMAGMGQALAIYFGDERSRSLENMSKSHNRPVDDDMFEDVFHFKAQDLTRLCAKKWYLGDTMNQFLSASTFESYVLVSIDLALKYTKGLFDGHLSSSFSKARKELSSFLELDADGLQDIMLEGLEQTLEGLAMYDNPDLLEYVPYPKTDTEIEIASQTKETVEFKGEPDLEKVKMTIDQLIKVPFTKQANVSSLMSLAIAGLHEGGDFDRVVFFLIDPATKKAQSKHMIQSSREMFEQRFNLEVEDDAYFSDLSLDLRKPEGFLIRNILREDKFAWVSPASTMVLRKLRNHAFNQVMGSGQFFVAPIIVKKQKIGFYYCDRQISFRKLDVQSYDVFVDICLQTNKSLEMLQDR